MKKKVFVGLSGGVDSAVAAHLLLEGGYNVTGVFMKNWSGEEYGVEDLCPWKEDLEWANMVATHLGIPLKVYNFEKEYREAVIEDFFYQYSIGNTPNPDILCNKYIKFSKFLNRAASEGAELIATGHYSKTVGGQLFRAKDQNKDQTYFLSQLNKSQLEASIFPLSNLLKNEVREIANQVGLPNAKRKDSQGICFVGKIDIKDFLKKELKEKKGEIIDIDTQKVVGEHNGVWFTTIGQRHGLKLGGSDQPYFVCRKDVGQNIIYVAKGSHNPKLYANTALIENFNQISPIPNKIQLSGQVRHRGSLYSIQLEMLERNGSYRVSFFDPAWAVAPGQSLVVYHGNQCLGGGIIKSVID